MNTTVKWRGASPMAVSPALVDAWRTPLLARPTGEGSDRGYVAV